ncbi:MAG: hypothetical protein APR55_08850 [Methanolinea sp. SDB]|nr:MAG: hypothetical protein APR55_08850 [Methanolinea sp. SDB]
MANRVLGSYLSRAARLRPCQPDDAFADTEGGFLTGHCLRTGEKAGLFLAARNGTVHALKFTCKTGNQAQQPGNRHLLMENRVTRSTSGTAA